jgi:hypothetical protein
MDHETIDREQIVERYLTGRLPAEQANAFEEHSLACDACLDRLEAAEGLRRGLATVAAEDLARVTAASGLAALLYRWSRSRVAPWLLVAAFLVTLLPGGYLAWRHDEMLADLESARRDSRAAVAERDRRAVEADVLAAELAEARAARNAPGVAAPPVEPARPDPPASPQLNVPILSLGPERSAGGEAAELVLPANGWAVLALEPARLDASPYAVRLRDATGDVAWEGNGLELDSLGTVTLTLPGSLLRPGKWVLELAGAGAGAPQAGRFVFIVR